MDRLGVSKHYARSPARCNRFPHTLTGGNAYNYTWDAFDRLRQSSRTGGATVDYTYDVGDLQPTAYSFF